MYTESGALRVSIDFENGSSYITATSGVASFPEDADDFDDLFKLIDKMLYHGKSKGRNCYSIYDHERHKDIEITRIAERGICTIMNTLREMTEKREGIAGKLETVTPFITEILMLNDLYYIGSDEKMRAVNDKDFIEEAGDIARVMDDDIFSENTLEKVKKNSPVFYSALKNNGFESALVVRIRQKDEVHGYIVCAVKRSLRIWQDNECAIMYYLAGLLI